MRSSSSNVLPIEELLARVEMDDEDLVSPNPLLLVDAGSRVDRDESELATAVARLRSLPAVVLGVGSTVAGSPAWRVCDAFVEDGSAVEEVAAQVSHSPLASVALALLLRGRDGRTKDESLVAESTTYSMLQAGPEFAAWRSSRPPPSTAISTAASPEAALRWSVNGNRMRITLCADRHNAFSRNVRDALVEALRFGAADPELSIVLDGDGPSFSSGGDLDEFGSFRDPISAHIIRLQRSAGRLLAALGDRVEARVHGYCFGAGVELSSFAHRVIARREAVFCLPEIKFGLVPGAGGTASLPPRIGRHRTALMGLTAMRLDAETALSWGLVDAVVDEFVPV